MSTPPRICQNSERRDCRRAADVARIRRGRAGTRPDLSAEGLSDSAGRQASLPLGVEFLGDGVGLPGGMTIEGYEEAIPRVVPVAEALAKRGAKVISVFGSSLTFYKGGKFHEELMQRVTKATGVKSTTQSNGLLDGLRTAGAKRVALATAYTDEVTGRLKIFLEELRVRGHRRQRPRALSVFPTARTPRRSCTSSRSKPMRRHARPTHWSCPAARCARSMSSFRSRKRLARPSCHRRRTA